MAASSLDLKAFLVSTPFFGGLSDASLDLLISMLVERRFDAGVTVVSEGEPGRSMYIVHAGELAVTKLGNSGRVIRIGGFGPGDFFGEMTLIEMQNRSATVIAETPTVLYELTARNLYAYYKGDIRYKGATYKGTHEAIVPREVWYQVQSVLDSCRKAVVALESNGGTASGVIVSPDGLVLTAAHVTGAPGKKVKVTLPGGKTVEAESLGLDEATGLVA